MAFRLCLIALGRDGTEVSNASRPVRSLYIKDLSGMDPQRKTVDMSSLKRAENSYRTRLANEPGDTTVRTKLAWCLFMEALFRAGQESMLAALFTPVSTEAVWSSSRMKLVWDQNADDLLMDCIKQTVAVFELSQNPQDRIDVERLKTLVELSGGSMVTSKAQEEASSLRDEVLRDVLGE